MPTNLPDEHPADSVTLTFSKKQFTDFIFDHAQSASEERFEKSIGFRITRNDIKRVVDKIDYFINTNNRVAESAFSAEVQLDDEKSFRLFGYEDFFSIDRFEPIGHKRVSIQLSYLVSFDRALENSAPEKQTVTIQFTSLAIGSSAITVRSTEFTWPSPIIQIFRNEVLGLNEVLVRDNSNIALPDFAFNFSAETNRIVFWPASLFNMVASGILVLALSILLFQNIRIGGHDAVVYSQELGTFLVANVNDLVENMGWLDAAEAIRSSQELFELGFRGEVNKEKEIAENRFSSYYLLGFGALVAIIFAIGVAGSREALMRSELLKGKIWLSNAAVPPIKRIPMRQGIYSGVLASLLASGILYLIAPVKATVLALF